MAGSRNSVPKGSCVAAATQTTSMSLKGTFMCMCVCWEYPQCYLSRTEYLLFTDPVVPFKSQNLPGLTDGARVFQSSTPESQESMKLLFHRQQEIPVFLLSSLGNLARSLSSLQVGFSQYHFLLCSSLSNPSSLLSLF